MQAFEQQMSNFPEKMNSTPKHNGPSLSPCISPQHVESSKKQTEDVVDKNGIKVSGVVDEAADLTEAGKSLPFAKSLDLWMSIESMEVFQKIPQNPHFRNLESCRENVREGLAIGYMAIFSTVVNKVSKLQLNDPKHIMDEFLVTLSDLERHGFDVGTVKDRISRLLALKCEQERLLDEAKELNSQLLKQKSDKSRMEEEMMDIDEEIGVLQDDLTDVIPAKSYVRKLIAVLADGVKDTEAKIRDAGTKFEAMALL